MIAVNAARVAWARARQIAFDSAAALAYSRVDLADAAGRELAQPVLALCDVPHYASSAMDGWAVRGAGPWSLVDAAAAQLGPGEARVIVTGGLVPAGCDAVLRSEAGVVESGGASGTVGGARLQVLPGAAAPTAGLHIRPPAEEFARGETAIEAGVSLNPAHIAVAAACGVDTVLVRSRGRVSLVLTGDEVVTQGIPAPGAVRDSFGPQLPAFVRLLGADVVAQQRLRDDREALVSALSVDAESSDLVITTGGTGSSAADHLRAALVHLGADIVVDGVDMRPGGPSILARLPDGRLLVALPGNPLAAMIGLLSLAHPVVEGLAGRSGPAPLRSVTLASDVPAGKGATRLIPFRWEGAGAVATAFTGSAMLRGLAEASGVLVCGPDAARAGSRLPYVRLPWGQSGAG